MILVIDFGSQTTHLIARRIKDLGAQVKIISPETALKQIKTTKPQGLILSGGPASVYEKGAPTINPKIFNLGIPILGICYGMQLTCQLLGGKVKPGKIKEYGPATLKINRPTPLFSSVSQHSQVWMSHGDEVITLPSGFVLAAETKAVRAVTIVNETQKIYGVQFHPEVEHTEHGTLILRNFLTKICRLKIKPQKINLPQLINQIKTTIGGYRAVAAVSGGVDSTVAAALVTKAVGNRLIPVYIDNGLMRLGTKELLTKIFNQYLHVPVIVVDAKKEFLLQLKSVTDPEQKRKIIGNLYIKLFEKEAKKHPRVKFLVQGTIYSDVIESQGTKHADKIKSHHNVGGLPEKMGLKLIEPLRQFYKDEVREIGRKLKLPKSIIARQPFPGPGQAIRIIGEITEERLAKQQQADQIVLEELEKAGWLAKVFQSFPIMTNVSSTAVKGDGRFYGEVMALRIYNSSDIMTAGWTHLPYDILQKISSRIVNEIPGISRVVYDITTKPPATMEWE